MDLLKIIREKCKPFASAEFYPAIEAVVHHIEIAEKHFEQAKNHGDYLYTDVIYRTNQAFEGALKEASRVLTGKDPSRQSPDHIVKYFESNRILKERVLAQFTNYRIEWRNKATHDYQLFFTAQEALLAIVSISAFFSILLDQMLEKYAHELERQKLREQAYPLLQYVRNYRQLDFFNQCVELLKHFAKSLEDDKQLSAGIPQYELLGKLSGFISSTDPSVKISSEKMVSRGRSGIILDLLLEKEGRAIIVELKGPSTDLKRRIRHGVEQLKTSLLATGIHEGILLLLPGNGRSVLTTRIETFMLHERPIRIAALTPSLSDGVTN